MCKCAIRGSALITFGCWCRVPAGTVDSVLSYCHYSLNDQTLADMIPYLKEKNVGIINASALSMGLLTDQASPGLAVNHQILFRSFVAFKLHVSTCHSKGCSQFHSVKYRARGAFSVAATLMHGAYLPYQKCLMCNVCTGPNSCYSIYPGFSNEGDSQPSASVCM